MWNKILPSTFLSDWTEPTKRKQNTELVLKKKWWTQLGGGPLPIVEIIHIGLKRGILTSPRKGMPVL